MVFMDITHYVILRTPNIRRGYTDYDVFHAYGRRAVMFCADVLALEPRCSRQGAFQVKTLLI